jgi:hypothetical protein
MATRKSEPARSRRPPATSPEDNEQRLIGLAADLAQRQLEDGSASAQVITHYLKLGSSRERLEQEKVRRETILLGARVEAMESAKRVEALYGEALAAMRAYQGDAPDPADEFDD